MIECMKLSQLFWDGHLTGCTVTQSTAAARCAQKRVSGRQKPKGCRVSWMNQAEAEGELGFGVPSDVTHKWVLGRICRLDSLMLYISVS